MLKSKLQPGAVVLKERDTEVKKWHWCKLVGGHDAPIDETEWLGEYLPIIAVVGKELNVNGEVIRKGIASGKILVPESFNGPEFATPTN